MEVKINNEHQLVNNNASLSEVIAMLAINDTKGMAIAINEEIIPHAKWNDQLLQENDNILIIRASQGG